MQVALRIKSFCGNPASDANSRVFSAFPIVIGRSANCDYRLEDPSRYISANHAIVTLEGQTVRIRDCSSNGVFIDNANSPIGRDQTISINHGCLISIGDYTLELALQDESTKPMRQNSPSGPAMSSDPFDVFENSDSAFEVQKPISPAIENSPAFTGQNPDPFAGEDWHKGIGESTNEPPPTPSAPSPAYRPPVKPISQSRPETSASQETVAIDLPHSSGKPDPWDDIKTPQPPVGGQPKPDRHRQEIPRPYVNDAPPKRHRPLPPQQAASKGHNSYPKEQQSVNQFLKGAGLTDSQAHAEHRNLDMFSTGRLLSQLTDGLMQLLKSRTEIKRAIKSDLTTLDRSDNNPLKFSYSANDALTKLLFNSGDPGYLTTEHAVDQAISDLNLHQVAMLEGMKAAVATLVREFDPQILEEKLESESPISASIPLRKEAKLWESYEERYAVLRDEAVSDFDELFSREFRKAYERKIKELGRTPDF